MSDCFATLWTVAHQAPLSMGILQTRMLEQVAIPFSRGSSQPQGSNLGFPHCKQILYHLSHQGSPKLLVESCKFLHIELHVLGRSFLGCDLHVGLTMVGSEVLCQRF